LHSTTIVTDDGTATSVYLASVLGYAIIDAGNSGAACTPRPDACIAVATSAAPAKRSKRAAEMLRCASQVETNCCGVVSQLGALAQLDMTNNIDVFRPGLPYVGTIITCLTALSMIAPTITSITCSDLLIDFKSLMNPKRRQPAHSTCSNARTQRTCTQTCNLGTLPGHLVSSQCDCLLVLMPT
jgi:hypothetical protein